MEEAQEPLGNRVGFIGLLYRAVEGRCAGVGEPGRAHSVGHAFRAAVAGHERAKKASLAGGERLRRSAARPGRGMKGGLRTGRSGRTLSSAVARRKETRRGLIAADVRDTARMIARVARLPAVVLVGSTTRREARTWKGWTSPSPSSRGAEPFRA